MTIANETIYHLCCVLQQGGLKNSDLGYIHSEHVEKSKKLKTLVVVCWHNQQTNK